jgi:hypothetical protein
MLEYVNELESLMRPTKSRDACAARQPSAEIVVTLKKAPVVAVKQPPRQTNPAWG